MFLRSLCPNNAVGPPAPTASPLVRQARKENTLGLGGSGKTGTLEAETFRVRSRTPTRVIRSFDHLPRDRGDTLYLYVVRR